MCILIQVNKIPVTTSKTQATIKQEDKTKQGPGQFETIDIVITCSIMVCAGLLGGWYNFLRTKESSAPKETSSRNFLTLCLIGGIIACVLVPIFLKTIQSDLLTGKYISTHDYLIFAGLCLIAAVFSNTFIDSISKRVIDQINTKVAKVEAKTVDTSIIANQAAVQAAAATSSAQKIYPVLDALSDQQISLSNDTDRASLIRERTSSINGGNPEIDIRQAILLPGILFRTAETVAEETNKSVDEVLAVFRDLTKEGKVELVTSEPTKHVFSIKAQS